MPKSSARSDRSFLRTKVPEITAIFWIMKLLTTGMGEAMSDGLGQKSVPLAAAVGVFGFAIAIWLQLRQPEYKAGYYWFAVMMVAIFGTMVADGIRDGVGLGYEVTTPMFALLTALVFWRWYRSEGTLSIHSIDTKRRELYYWAAVLGTFALGTAAGDLTALKLNWGYWPSAALFAGVFLIPAVGWWRLKWSPIFSFWFAYVVTRPLGASFADGFSKSNEGGLNLGDPLVSYIAFAFFLALVAWVAVTKLDVQRADGTVPGVHLPTHLPHPHESLRELAPELD